MDPADGAEVGLLARYLRGLKPLSLVYFTAFFLVGCALASIGPTMILLAESTGSTPSQVALLFPARSCAYLAGAAVGGPMFDRLPGNAILGASMLLCGLGMLLVPVVHNLFLLALAVSTSGLAMGVLDTGGNVLLMRLHGSEVSPYMQTMHFLFGLGAFASPLLVAACVNADRGSGLSWSFWAMALLFAPCGLLLMQMESPKHRQGGERACEGGLPLADAPDTSACKATETASAEGARDGEEAGEEQEGEEGGTRGRMQQQQEGDPARWMMVAGAVLLLLYVGSEVSFGGYIFVYAVEYMGWHEDPAFLLNALFWGSLAVGRLLAIPWSMVSGSAQILAVDLLGCAVALVIMCAWQQSEQALWSMTALYGLLMGPVFPCVMTYAEECTPVSSRQTAVLVVGAAFGEMLVPAILSLLFAGPPLSHASAEDHQAQAPAAGAEVPGAGAGDGARFGWLLWVLATTAFLSIGAFGALLRAGERTKRRRREEESPGLVANAA